MKPYTARQLSNLAQGRCPDEDGEFMPDRKHFSDEREAAPKPPPDKKERRAE